MITIKKNAAARVDNNFCLKQALCEFSPYRGGSGAAPDGRLFIEHGYGFRFCGVKQ
ncbi:hypothetical protein PQR62_05525 [Herbaspirillum lusitanum]|uniref:Uncharacterized protein n=1 Tax=Herbaspirillum lusitanum TaxID=213312 RepID=A0ABW9A5K3_9BURK